METKELWDLEGKNAVTEPISFSRPDQKYQMMVTSSALLQHLQRGGDQVFPRLEFSWITQQKTLPISPDVWNPCLYFVNCCIPELFGDHLGQNCGQSPRKRTQNLEEPLQNCCAINSLTVRVTYKTTAVVGALLKLQAINGAYVAEMSPAMRWSPGL